jgi:2-isopropylmalate synthase
MAGKATLELKAKQLGLALDGPALTGVIDELKRLEHEGFHFEAADGSLELLMRRATGWEQDFFEVESFRVIVGQDESLRADTEAIVKVRVGGKREMTIGEGNGPVNALDAALRKDLGKYSSFLSDLRLVDYKVRILTSGKDDDGTGAVTRVMVESADGKGNRWSTVGVSPNLVDAAFEALADSICYKLFRDGARA